MARGAGHLSRHAIVWVCAPGIVDREAFRAAACIVVDTATTVGITSMWVVDVEALRAAAGVIMDSHAHVPMSFE